MDMQHWLNDAESTWSKMAQAPAHSSHRDLISSFSLHQITSLKITAPKCLQQAIHFSACSVLLSSLVYIYSLFRILKLPIMAFSYSVKKVQLDEVSGNLLKTWCGFLVFLGGTVLLWEVEGGAPTSVSLPLHYNTDAAHSFPFIWPVCCEALWVDSPSGGLSPLQRAVATKQARGKCNRLPLVMQRDITVVLSFTTIQNKAR